MSKFAIILLTVLLQSCSGYLVSHASDDTRYFSDALNCFQSAERKESVKVPTGSTLSVIEVPVGINPSVFGSCMEQAGHPVPQVNPDDYLNVSRACMQQARGSSNPDEVYAGCVRHGKITVETMIPDRSK